MMADDIARYLDELTRKALAAGLDMAKPGMNWAPMRPIVRGSHISVSVRKDQIQVNLNNDDDVDRRKFRALWPDREAIEGAIGSGLKWDQKDKVKKTAIRATLDQGYAAANWDEQHQWAITTLQKFVREFGPRLARIG